MRSLVPLSMLRRLAVAGLAAVAGVTLLVAVPSLQPVLDELEGHTVTDAWCVGTTSWNGSPRDNAGRWGHWEESFVGMEIADLDNPVELFHVVRSHDAWLVCTAHMAHGSFTVR